MRIRIKAPELRSIWYVDVDPEDVEDSTMLRLRVAQALRCQWGRLSQIEATYFDGEEYVVASLKREAMSKGRRWLRRGASWLGISGLWRGECPVGC